MFEYNYKFGETVDVQKEFGVTKISDNKYVGVKPLIKPSPQSRGAFGGNLVGQALLVAIRSCPEGFSPHSLHSYFIRAANVETPVEWEVEIISNGKSFSNRAVKGIQEGVVVYMANISLTKKNSYKEALQKHEEHYAKIQQRGKDGDAEEDLDEDDEDEPGPPKPFSFQTPPSSLLKKYDIDKLPVSAMESTLLLYYKFPPEFVKLSKSLEENSLPPAERRLTALAKWGIENEQGYDQPLTNLTKDFQFVGLANVTDGLYLGTLLRLLRVKDIDTKIHSTDYVGISLDHVIYFHDDDFDVTKWMEFSYKCTRYAQDRVDFEGEIYNDKGVQVASFFQQGLVRFENGALLEKAKL